MKAADLLRTALRRPSLAQIRHVAPVPFRTAEPKVARIYRDLEREFGLLAPPIALHASSPDVLAASWALLRESMVAPGRADLASKEAVAVAVSEHNACPFCITVHSSMLTTLVGSGAAAHQPARTWAEAHATRPASVSAGVRGPGPDHLPEFVAVAVLLHYLNRMAHVFLGDFPLPPYVPPAALRAVMPALTRLRRSASRQEPAPGRSLDLLPAAALPVDLAWAADGPAHIARAFAQAAAVIDAAGERSVPDRVRELVLGALRVWDGAPPGLSRSWTEPLLNELPWGDRVPGRLALLVALAPYQVDAAAIGAYRVQAPDDASLVELAAWASMAAAREAGGWAASTGATSTGERPDHRTAACVRHYAERHDTPAQD
ncbi:carboxymuconolactone decarboxylase family protein [Streptomyces melanogenes]|uniref:carboxymuconolactone decarboxylase family protein n=1 Tax=Streptomyces melanogenes TaxID=67326 RepID=UPI0019B6D8DD|nr:carboxymuconolactone decarboxylase family protein [Streptomyces melanogenes]GGP92395.1 alkyl hydroperoxide reductase AhpD [Streptomyces melanogenes]